MKKILLSAAVACVAWVAMAQEPIFKISKVDSLRIAGFQLPDSLAHLSPWKHEFRLQEPRRATPTVTMSSVAFIQRKNLPSRVTVINNNTLRMGRRFSLSNGQAWANGPFPNAFLDARTLSMPLPR